MTTYLAQNQFISSSAPVVTPAADTATAPSPDKGDAVAEAISNSGTPPSTAVPDTAAADQVAPQVAAAEPFAVSQGRAVRTARVAHNHEVVGSNPTPATNSALASAMTADTAAAPDLTDPPVAAAVLIAESTLSTGVPQEAPASAPTKNPDAGAFGTDHIHEIFAGAAMFVSRFVPDMHAIVDAMEYENAPRAEYGAPTWDEAPLFLQRAAE